jgi:PAS domain S-box-containing protein
MAVLCLFGCALLVPVALEQRVALLLTAALVLIPGSLLTRRLIQVAELDDFFRLTLEMVGMIDLQGRIKLVNPSFLKAVGYSEDELKGRNLGEFIEDISHASWQYESRKILQGQPISGFEAKLKLKGGTTRYVSFHFAPSLRMGLCYFSARDITEVKETEISMIQASKMSTLGEMAAGIAHEINNPLTILNGKVARIKKEVSKQPLDLERVQAELLGIQNVSARIAKIVSGLRTFSTAGEHEPMDHVSVKKIVEDTLQLCLERLKMKEIEFRMGDFRDVLIYCRETEISQVFYNLITNASEAIEKLPKRWIQFDVEETSSEVLVRISDSGPGIPQAIRHKIMEPFFTTKGDKKATGLGLSISSGIMKSHQGSITIDPGGFNTCFVLSFPK